MVHTGTLSRNVPGGMCHDQRCRTRDVPYRVALRVRFVVANKKCRGLHGYSHENPVAMTLEQQHAILDKTYKQLTDFCGKPPRGSVAPWWEASREGAELMLKYGVEYGNSYHSLATRTNHMSGILIDGDQTTPSPTTTASLTGCA